MDATTRFRLLETSIFVICIVLTVSGILGGLALFGRKETAEDIALLNIIIIFTPVTLIVGVPLLIVAIVKHRKSELTNPTRLTKLYFRRRDAKQCTICQKHPVSKKYHLKSEHKLKDFNLDDYFRDCGCDKCAIYNKSSIED